MVRIELLALGLGLVSVKDLTLDARAFETVEEQTGYYHQQRVAAISDGDPIAVAPGALFVVHVLPEEFTDETPFWSSNRPGYADLPLFRRGQAHGPRNTATGVGALGPSVGDPDAPTYRCFTHLAWTGVMEIVVSMDSPHGDGVFSGVLYEAGVVAMIGQTLALFEEYDVDGPYRIEMTLQNLDDFEVVYSDNTGFERRFSLGTARIEPFGLTLPETLDDLREELAPLVDSLWHVAGYESPYLTDGEWTAASHVESFE